jgi:membrane-associated protease RseP (regulator of RpoE activity)
VEAKGPATVTVDDGKIVIVDEHGNKQEIDVSGAKSIIVNRSSKTQVIDGQEERKIVGKAIVVDAQGNKTEIDLGEADIEMDEKQSQFEMRMVPMMEGVLKERLGALGKGGDLNLQLTSPLAKYFIGVQCTPLDDEQRALLELDDEGGLMVVAVTEESPALGAGIQADDVLLFAGETALTTPEVLIKAVQEAGEKSKEIKLTIIRDGKEQQVSVKPAEREANELEQFNFDFEGIPQEMQEKIRIAPQILEQVGPGIIRAREAMNEEIQQQMRNAHEQMQKAHEQMQKANEQMRLQMQELQDQIKQLNKQIEKMNRDK